MPRVPVCGPRGGTWDHARHGYGGAGARRTGWWRSVYLCVVLENVDLHYVCICVVRVRLQVANPNPRVGLVYLYDYGFLQETSVRFPGGCDMEKRKI